MNGLRKSEKEKGPLLETISKEEVIAIKQTKIVDESNA